MKTNRTIGKYLELRCKLTFKPVFAEHPDLVISFLNAPLPFRDGVKVVDIEYICHKTFKRMK